MAEELNLARRGRWVEHSTEWKDFIWYGHPISSYLVEYLSIGETLTTRRASCCDESLDLSENQALDRTRAPLSPRTVHSQAERLTVECLEGQRRDSGVQ